MAAVAQYYSDNLRSEVLKGMHEKLRQGWPTGLACYAYINVDDRDEPVQPHPEKSQTLVRAGTPEHPLAGGLFRCTYCRQSITGERIRRRLKGGGAQEHIYYRCANNHPRTELCAAVNDVTACRRRQAGSLAKRKTELSNMQDRLLNAYLVGTVEEVVFKAKSNELKAELAKTDEALAQMGDTAPARGETALALFDWTQRAADAWRGSNPAIRREILDCVCLNRTLGDVSLCLAKRKPFDIFAEGLDLKNSRGDWI